jgi:hypothetical protein
MSMTCGLDLHRGQITFDTAPEHSYYAAVKEVHNGKVAAISIARKLARRCYHTLRNLDPEVVYAMP